MTRARVGLLLILIPASIALLVPPAPVGGQGLPSTPTAQATLVAAPLLTLPGEVDSNSPAIWDVEDGQRRLYVMTSFAGAPNIAEGPSLDRLGKTVGIGFTGVPRAGVWMEAVVSDEVDTWYGFYHNEVAAIACGRPDRAVARIGAARSVDHGRSWRDLGIILEAAADSVACRSSNRYVIGGVGDLSVLLDSTSTNLYIFFSQYQAQASAQGVTVARLLWADRDRPIGRVDVWQNGTWDPARLRRIADSSRPSGQRLVWEYPVGSPLVAAAQAWHDNDSLVDAYWGPSVHWNQGIQQYVMLLNRAKDENYTQDGVYISFAPRLDDPRWWSPPQKLLTGGKWYPQVIGLTEGQGTDKSASTVARLFVSGRSEWFINFSRQVSLP
ncbi:MAG: hypothetical protein ACRD2N_08300 [Vicinamibacterales bacterium]